MENQRSLLLLSAKHTGETVARTGKEVEKPKMIVDYNTEKKHKLAIQLISQVMVPVWEKQLNGIER